MREEKLVEQLSDLLQGISAEEVATKITLKPELDKFMLLRTTLHDFEPNNEKIEPKIDLSGFIRYILQNGNKEQKRELISCLNKTIYIKNRELITK